MIEIVQRNLAAITALCRKHGVARLYLIGSAARGDFDEARSDIDFLVEYTESARLDWCAGLELKDALSVLLGREVDMIESRCVRNPVVRASMERTKVPLYDAA